jgi:hypothetical protein
MQMRRVAAATGVILFGLTQPSLARDDLRNVIGTLSAILNPADARRYEEQARLNHRLEEERYWREYWYGLEDQRAERYREEARERHRVEEERYWRAYRAGLDDEARYREREFDRGRYDDDRRD